MCVILLKKKKKTQRITRTRVALSFLSCALAEKKTRFFVYLVLQISKARHLTLLDCCCCAPKKTLRNFVGNPMHRTDKSSYTPEFLGREKNTNAKPDVIFCSNIAGDVFFLYRGHFSGFELLRVSCEIHFFGRFLFFGKIYIREIGAFSWNEIFFGVERILFFYPYNATHARALERFKIVNWNCSFCTNDLFTRLLPGFFLSSDTDFIYDGFCISSRLS